MCSPNAMRFIKVGGIKYISKEGTRNRFKYKCTRASLSTYAYKYIYLLYFLCCYFAFPITIRDNFVRSRCLPTRIRNNILTTKDLREFRMSRSRNRKRALYLR